MTAARAARRFDTARMQLRALAVGALAASSIACGKDSAGPAPTRVLLIVAAGDRQYGLAGATLQAPLQVVVVNAVSETPADDVRVEWSIVEGTGASLTAAAFVFFLVVVVTIYYVDPLRLPPFARDLLSMVLGG